MKVDSLLLVSLIPSCLVLLGQVWLSDALTTLETNSLSRRGLLRKSVGTLLIGGGILLQNDVAPAVAAPPIAVIAEELGYFPVQNREGQVMYIPKRVQRKSTDQAIELAKLLNEKGITMYGAYWCPHCSRQKELFGAEAWGNMNYVECAPKGYGFKGICKDVDGYPSFKDKRGRMNFSGERSLADIAQQVGYKSFDPSLEGELPMIGSSCKLR
jgi:hypothetical protein